MRTYVSSPPLQVSAIAILACVMCAHFVAMAQPTPAPMFQICPEDLTFTYTADPQDVYDADANAVDSIDIWADEGEISTIIIIAVEMNIEFAMLRAFDEDENEIDAEEFASIDYSEEYIEIEVYGPPGEGIALTVEFEEDVNPQYIRTKPVTVLPPPDPCTVLPPLDPGGDN